MSTKSTSSKRTRTRKPQPQPDADQPSAATIEPLLDSPPRTPDALHTWLLAVLGLDVVRRQVVPNHAAPFDYLVHAFFEGTGGERSGGVPITPDGSPDCVVWANRGGGKTFLAAIATLLDLIFKPGIQVRLLGGSLEQSRRVYEHLRAMLDRDQLRHLVKGRPTTRRIALTNGSAAQVLAASQTSVRGVRVQKVRCDEVDLFDPDVWSAAQLTTRSMHCPGPWGDTVRGSVEALSTMHRPFGLMWGLVGEKAQGSRDEGPRDQGASDQSNSATGAAQAAPPSSIPRSPDPLIPASIPRPIFRWGLLDVLELCPPARDCRSCALWTECRGAAKRATDLALKVSADHPPSLALSMDPSPGLSGHIRVDDALRLKARVSAATWRSEMLCLQPRRTDAVYSEFSSDVHVIDDDRPLARPVRFVAGMDFGFRSEAVVLLGAIDSAGVLTIIAEHAATEQTIAQHVQVIRSWLGSGMCPPDGPLDEPRIDFISIDPAGRQRSDQTGASAADVLARSGFRVRDRIMSIREGIALVRARLNPAWNPESPGQPRLRIRRSCTRLIECLTTYHYPPHQPTCDDPVKDGSDHACDALRYLITALDGAAFCAAGSYIHGRPVRVPLGRTLHRAA